jgi:hypothetical protein
MATFCVTPNKHANLAGRNTMFVSQAAFDALDKHQSNLRVYVKVGQHALCVAPSPELADDCAYLDQALCTFVGVSHNDKVDVEPIKVRCANYLESITVEAWALAPCEGQHRNSLAARVRQEFYDTLVSKDQTLFVCCDDVDWKVVVRGVRSDQAGTSPWGCMSSYTSVVFLNIHQVSGKAVQASCDEATKASIASMTKKIMDLEATLCTLRTILFDLQHDLQQAPASPDQVEVAKAFVDSFSPKEETFFIRTAYRHPHMRPFITSTTFYANFVDAKTSFDALVKRKRLDCQEEDEDNAFGLCALSVTKIDLAVDFDQNRDYYAMLGATRQVVK